jgi:hypothetical protein
MIKIKSMKNNEKFFDEIQDLCNRGYDPIDAILNYSTVNNVDIELCGSWIKQSPILKKNVENYAINNFLLKDNTPEIKELV